VTLEDVPTRRSVARCSRDARNKAVVRGPNGEPFRCIWTHLETVEVDGRVPRASLLDRTKSDCLSVGNPRLGRRLSANHRQSCHTRASRKGRVYDGIQRNNRGTMWIGGARMMLFRSWHEQILGRFPQREPLSLEESLRAHWTEFNPSAAKAVLELIEDEYGIPAGMLRPSDPLRLLLGVSRSGTRSSGYFSRADRRTSRANWNISCGVGAAPVILLRY
jgi:hypothetical protein